MTREQQFTNRWNSDKQIFRLWGEHISSELFNAVGRLIQPISPDYFFKTKVTPRLKDDQRLVEKAFYRNKNYGDPYDDITDKVGTRFVVLLGRDIRVVEQALEQIEGWTRSRDRDYEEEQNKNPIAFDYAAVHYVVRPVEDIVVSGVRIPAGTPCEVQIKTILQHAYSELTHDTIYKPQIQATPAMQRDAAKAMALLEATNDYFEKVADQVNAALSTVAEITRKLTAVYEGATGLTANPSLLEGLFLDAYEDSIEDDYIERTEDLLRERPFIIERIRERVSQRNPIFSQPAVLLAYLDAARRGQRALASWPLTPDEMEPLLNDLGQSRF